MVQLKTIKDPTDLLVSFNFSQKTPKSKCSSCVANEARRAELAITNLISNKREWNNCFIKNAPKI